MLRWLRAWWLVGLGALLIVAGLATWLLPRVSGQQAVAEAMAAGELLQLTPTSRVADVGAGDGYLTRPLAGLLSDGYVYATEIDLARLETLRRRLSERGLDNVTLLEGGVEDTNLPPSCCDAIVLRRVYHHLTAPAAFVEDLVRALRPGGRLLVIDFAPDGWRRLLPTPTGVPANRGGHGIHPDLVHRRARRGRADSPAAGPGLVRGRLRPDVRQSDGGLRPRAPRRRPAGTPETPHRPPASRTACGWGLRPVVRRDHLPQGEGPGARTFTPW